MDFYCPELRLAIEADGGQHNPDGDAARTSYLKDRGIRVLRFTNIEILKQTESVSQSILQALEEPSP